MYDSNLHGTWKASSWYKNPNVDELLRSARINTNRDERAKLYQQAARLVVDDSPGHLGLQHGRAARHARQGEGFQVLAGGQRQRAPVPVAGELARVPGRAERLTVDATRRRPRSATRRCRWASDGRRQTLPSNYSSPHGKRLSWGTIVYTLNRCASIGTRQRPGQICAPMGSASLRPPRFSMMIWR